MALIENEPAALAGASDESASRAWLRALEAIAPIAQTPQRILPALIAESAEQHGAAPALISGRETLTYQGLVARANRYARWALAQKLGNGDTVCLMMPNRPEYLAIWLGVTSMGGVVSLINTQLRGQSLAHCIDLVAPKHVIVADELIDEFRSAPLTSRPDLW